MSTSATKPTHHDQLLASLSSHLANGGFTDIHMDHREEWPCPTLIRWSNQAEGEGCRPDAVAFKGGVRYVIEVEDGLTFASAHTMEQLKLFAASTDTDKGKTALLVPTASRAAARAALDKAGFQRIEVWTADIQN